MEIAYIECQCFKCNGLFAIEVPAEINNFFINGQELENNCGKTKCPFCGDERTLLLTGRGDIAQIGNLEVGEWFPSKETQESKTEICSRPACGREKDFEKPCWWCGNK